MHQIKPLRFLAFLIIFYSCKKGDNSTKASTTPPVDCNIARSGGNSATDEYIVAYNPDSVDARMMSNDRMSQVGQDVLKRNNILPSVLEKTFGGEPGGFLAHLSPAEVIKLQADPNVQTIEHDRIIALGTCFTVAEPNLITWNIQKVGYGDGTGKTAWIIDTGIDFNHPDLTVDQIRSKSFISGVTSANDENGHGTHVAGIIGAKNNTFGVLGVASGATLVSLRVLGKDGEGLLSSIIEALSYLNANAQAGDVVNMSVGEDTVSSILDQQVQNTASKGIYFAIAAGNDGKPAKNYSPGRANGANIFTVSAVDSLDNFASFSNYGNDVVDYAAPGVHILSTYLDGKYAYMTGTSMATPHVAGLLLLRGKNLTTAGTAKEDPDGTADPIAHF